MRLKFRIMQAVDKFTARNTQFQFPLLDLPNELIAHIIEQVDNIRTLRRLARTCRRVQHLAEPALYRSILVRTGPETNDIRLALDSRPERAAGIHYLEIPCHARYRQDFEAIADLLDRARNLKELIFESPQCNTSEFEDAETWREMATQLFEPFQNAVALEKEVDLARKPLQKLRRLTLHCNGPDSPYWTLDSGSLAIFLLPNLQFLKVSCVNILDRVLEDAKDKSSKTLKHLELEECNVSHRGLHGILSVPQDLEVLYLGENCHNILQFADDIDPGSNHLFTVNPQLTVDALKQQSSTLTTFTYTTTETYFQHRHLARIRDACSAPIDAGFTDFNKLTKVSLIGHCPNFERALMTSCSPPILKTLEFKALTPFRRELGSTAEDHAIGIVPFLRAPSASVPSTLKNIDISFGSTAYDADGNILPSQTKNLIEVTSKATRSMGVHLRFFFKPRSHYFPPYLYGEPTPVETLVYDGSLLAWTIVHLWG
ncbi:hypothetical protein M409DRAFT_70325 [Zasmidium cellare ATCC 36951]|uniref:F-box domain-containing protein n=1 Tax=Zasmidium cellare ATCC 36951 TaxID=1080233 RepID=A0A6A6C0N4_ZASCE|nr:uncharacterized protein M409DRAFT_70325 [Zasmidium cellare ATCC 36951]KAF2160571.1 hypothetical protein M409DRAFT_70325 [Zasmidium cellare ATCC 36951]